MRRRKAQEHKKDRDQRRAKGESAPHPHAAHLDDDDDEVDEGGEEENGDD